MVSRPHLDTLAVEQHTGVVMMCVADKERYDSTLAGSRTEYPHIGNFGRHTRGSIFEKLMFVGGYIFYPCAVYEFHCLDEGRGIDKIGRTGLKLVW